LDSSNKDDKNNPTAFNQAKLTRDTSDYSFKRPYGGPSLTANNNNYIGTGTGNITTTGFEPRPSRISNVGNRDYKPSYMYSNLTGGNNSTTSYGGTSFTPGSYINNSRQSI